MRFRHGQIWLGQLFSFTTPPDPKVQALAQLGTTNLILTGGGGGDQNLRSFNFSFSGWAQLFLRVLLLWLEHVNLLTPVAQFVYTHNTFHRLSTAREKHPFLSPNTRVRTQRVRVPSVQESSSILPSTPKAGARNVGGGRGTSL